MTLFLAKWFAYTLKPIGGVTFVLLPESFLICMHAVYLQCSGPITLSEFMLVLL